MNLFEEDYVMTISDLKGFNQLDACAQHTLKSICFSLWVKGVQRAQMAQAEGAMFKLATAMVEETVSLMHSSKAINEAIAEAAKESMQ